MSCAAPVPAPRADARPTARRYSSARRHAPPTRGRAWCRRRWRPRSGSRTDVIFIASRIKSGAGRPFDHVVAAHERVDGVARPADRREQQRGEVAIEAGGQRDLAAAGADMLERCPGRPARCARRRWRSGCASSWRNCCVDALGRDRHFRRRAAASRMACRFEAPRTRVMSSALSGDAVGRQRAGKRRRRPARDLRQCVPAMSKITSAGRSSYGRSTAASGITNVRRARSDASSSFE